jgi:hypothetical protein
MSCHQRRHAGTALFLLVAALTSPLRAAIDTTLEQPDLVEPLFFALPAQPMPTVSSSFVFDGSLGEWPPEPLLNTVDRRNGAPEAQAWIGSDDAGVVIAARVPAADDITLNVRIASLSHLTLPPIGWLNRFTAPHYYRSAADCAFEHPENLYRENGQARCREWFARQGPYRENLAANFVRQWRIHADGRSEERGIDSELSPAGALALKSASADTATRTLEIRLPWDAWPATDQLELARLYTQVSLCRGEQCQILQRGREERGVWFSTWQLATPRRYQVACGFPLQGTSHPRLRDFGHGYFLPDRGDTVSSVIALRLPAAGYQDAPDGFSPMITRIDYSALSLGDSNDFLCGPPVSYRNGDTLRRTDASWIAEPTQFFPIDDGNVLAVTGTIEFDTITGMGQGGACPRRGIEAFYIDRHSGEVTAWRDEYSLECADDSDSIEYTVRGPREIVANISQCRYEAESAPGESAAASAEKAASDQAYVRYCRTIELVHCLKPGQRKFEECERREDPPARVDSMLTDRYLFNTVASASVMNPHPLPW